MPATRKLTRRQELIRIRTEETPGCHVTDVQIGDKVEVAVLDGFLTFWTAGREVRVGPLTPDQAEKLAEDLGYEALEDLEADRG